MIRIATNTRPRYTANRIHWIRHVQGPTSRRHNSQVNYERTESNKQDTEKPSLDQHGIFGIETMQNVPLALSHSSDFITPRHFYQNTILMDRYYKHTPRAVSLRQLCFFGRRLTKDKLLASAEFVRTELPVRMAHRIRDMQQLPYMIMSNPHLSSVYELYCVAFDQFRKFSPIRSMDDNARFCELLYQLLDLHLSVIPKLIMGAIEAGNNDNCDTLDSFVNKMLRSRISRRVIAEQHILLTKAFKDGSLAAQNCVGHVLPECTSGNVISSCAEKTRRILAQQYPAQRNSIPQIVLEGDITATFPYIQSQLEYIIGEILRNSIEATIIRHYANNSQRSPHKIVVTISDTEDAVHIRFSDQGGGISNNILSSLWSFANAGGISKFQRLENFQKIPRLAGLSDEIADEYGQLGDVRNFFGGSSLSNLSSRPPGVKLGIGMPMSKVYAEYWAGELSLHSLEGYGCDIHLQVSKLGNQSEQLQLDSV